MITVMLRASPGQAAGVVGVVGVGRMGLPICARLAQQGFLVVATDVRPDARAGVIAAGGHWADSVAGVAADVEVVISVLPGPAEVAAICEQLIAALSPGSTWIDMSTATPPIAREISRLASARNVRTLDAPVGGGPSTRKRVVCWPSWAVRPSICSHSAECWARSLTGFFTLGWRAVATR